MSKPVIICVDDEPAVLESLKIELKRILGDECLIETAEGGEEALELFQELQRDEYEVALVLADYIMPDIRGDELFRQIHALSPNTLNIMVSGQADLDAVANAIRHARLYRYIAKPWKPDDLKTTVIDAVQSYLQDCKLESQNNKLLLKNQELEQLINDLQQAKDTLQRQASREQALNHMVQAIRQSLDLGRIFSTAVFEIGKLLQTDRAKIYRYIPEQKLWLMVADACRDPKLPSLIGLQVPDQDNPIMAHLKQLEIVQIEDAGINEHQMIRDLAEICPGSWLLVPLDFESDSSETSSRVVWGCLCLTWHTPLASWQGWESEIACAVADQLAIAIQQSELYHQVQQFNMDLERQVQERTTQLQRVLDFAALSQRITDKVRDSLDESQILQTAVQELATQLQINCCDAALYDLDLRTSKVCYEHICSEVNAAKGIVTPIDNRPDIYNQVLQGNYVHFCAELDPCRNINHPFAILVFPLMDEQRVLGDMWLFKPHSDYFDDLEIHLVQQVANQCAIALRQSRLYQTIQTQVKELERLNSLKDDFLSSVSHEMRSPMSNIKMATQMLESILQRAGMLERLPEAGHRYFQILQEECKRETELINDLLDLARLEAEVEPLALSVVDLTYWLAHLTEPFIDRIHIQQQHLEIDIPSELPMFTTDTVYLERAVMELLHNACKYTPAEERITISVRTIEAEEIERSQEKEMGEQVNPAELSNMAALLKPQNDPPSPPFSSYNSAPIFPAPIFQISVRNTGVEISEAERDRIFDKFYRIPKNDLWKQGGTGLGLALVQRQIERLGGTIAVSSEPSWTMFTIYLPNLTTKEAGARN